MQIETHCITDLRSAKVMIGIQKLRDPTITTLVVPQHVQELLWEAVGAGKGSIKTDYILTRYWLDGAARNALIVGNIEIMSENQK